MRIGNVTIDTDNMTLEELDELVQEARRVRARKKGAREKFCAFENLLADMKDSGYAFCSRDTGEVLRAKDWVVYDEEEHSIQEAEWML